MDVVKHILKNFKFKIYPYKNGLFNVDKQTFDDGDLNSTLLKFIKTFSSMNKIHRIPCQYLLMILKLNFFYLMVGLGIY